MSEKHAGVKIKAVNTDVGKRFWNEAGVATEVKTDDFLRAPPK